MTYPDHYLLQFGGTLGTGQAEIWSCGIRLVLQNAAPDDFDPDGGYLDDIAVPALSAWMGRSDSRIASFAVLQWVKCNQIGPNGKYADQTTTHERFLEAPVPGAVGSPVLPFQCSVVLSWETDNASRGPASKGRIYSPAPAVAMDGGSGTFAPAQALSMATSAKDLLNSLDDSVSIAGQIRPAIVSGVGGGHQNEINRVRVDNVVDTQRRRRNALVGTSQTVSFSY